MYSFSSFCRALNSNVWFDGAFSLVPKEVTQFVDIAETIQITDGGRVLGQIVHTDTPLPVHFNFFSSMFMHAGYSHIFGNMLFPLGSLATTLRTSSVTSALRSFILHAELPRAVAQVALGPDSIIPMLGASGAISGVLGGYVLLFPTRKVNVLLFRFYQTVPAWIALGFWIGLPDFPRIYEYRKSRRRSRLRSAHRRIYLWLFDDQDLCTW